MGIFLTGSLVQTIILINNENYGFPAYQGSLLALAVLAICYLANVYGAKTLPYWQNAVFLFHILAYFAYIVPIWVSAPAATHYQVWGEFQNEGGWSNMALAILVGQLTGISEQVGIDTVSNCPSSFVRPDLRLTTTQTAHMAEEVKDAAKTIPRTMMAVYVLNTVLLFPALLTVVYHIPDLDAALADSTTYPAIYVLRMSMSNIWITVILSLIGFIQCASSINYFAAVTRDLFAFARDNGMPYSAWLGTVHPRKHIPINAGQLSCVIGGLLSLIYIGSPVAFYAITSLCTVSLLMCYSMSIGSVLYRRIYAPETLPPAKFSLGRRGGIACNAAAVAFSVWAFFWSFFPQELPITAAGFNWASPIFVAVFVFSMFYYWWRARHVYVGPVKEVEGR